MGLLPFGPEGIEGGPTYEPLLDGVPWDIFYEWWYRILVWRLDIEIAMDPDTVFPGAPTTALYSMFLTRQLEPHATEKERAMIRPGARDNYLTGPLNAKSLFHGALNVPLPGDDYFSSISWSATMQLCGLAAPGGHDPTPAEPGTRYSIDRPALEFHPGLTLAIHATYDDGSEGVFTIQLHDPSLATEPPDDVITGLGTMDGIAFVLYAVGFNPFGTGRYSWGGVPPVISLTPVEWCESRRSDETEPIVDKNTGLVLPGMTPFTNVL